MYVITKHHVSGHGKSIFSEVNTQRCSPLRILRHEKAAGCNKFCMSQSQNALCV